MSLCDCLCVCVFHLTKIDQAEEPETFLNFAWPYTEFVIW